MTPPARVELELWESCVRACWPGGPQLMLARAIAQSVDLHTLTVRTDYAAFRDHLARRCHMRHLTAMRRGVGRLVAAGLLADLGDHSHRITYPRSHT